MDSVDNADAPRAGEPDFAGLNTRKGDASDQATRSTTDGDYPQLRGSDLARAALQAAKDASGGQPRTPNKQAKRGFGTSRRRRRWSGARADERDPQPLGRLVSRVSTERGWAGELATGRLFGRWAAIVGEDVAEHAQPVSLRDKELTVQAASTAWATQLRLLQRQLIAKIAAGVGDGVVTRLKVQGPSAPSWRHGTRHVPGRGPRDTYG
ncbi:DciA family protein [Actinophytocola gossypii]|uniref:DciA family protein n=1 Tax=Actinophytocola gossypii TaxID=2812003 RepID=UPI0035CCE6EB